MALRAGPGPGAARASGRGRRLRRASAGPAAAARAASDDQVSDDCVARGSSYGAAGRTQGRQEGRSP